VRARPELSLTLPYKIEFILHRAKEDGSDKPCIFRWSPTIDGFSPSGVVLLHHGDSSNSDGPKICEVDYTKPLKSPNEDYILADAQNSHLYELAPGGEARCIASLPARYYQALHAGEMYTLLYPGGEVAMWDWGTVEEHLMSSSEENSSLSTLMIPGGARVSFTARAEETPWLGRADYEARNGFELANLAEQQWRQEEARKGMRIIEGWPAPFGPEDRVYIFTLSIYFLESLQN
jgi:hypothetical protein